MKALLMVVGAALVFAGCGDKKAEVAKAPEAPANPALAKIVVKDPAPAAIGVKAAKADLKTGDKAVVEGKVKDFVEGAAVITLVDLSMKDCKQRGEGCETPWDYCCEDPKAMTAATATVQAVGDGAAPLPGSLKGVGTIDHLITVVAEGKVEKDDSGNLVIKASRIYVK
ncbi:MAG: hypothetical protein K1X53_07775 [Candidatus Sumerlaeaceae bacterium]|nr:hypothetical protein [Candidatus Sumerlaeaceae bacterium]